MRIYLVRIPRRKGHSIQRDVLPGSDHFWLKLPHPRSDSSWPDGRDLKLRYGNSDRTTGPNLGSLGLLSIFLRWDDNSLKATMPLTWAEDRALLGSNPSAALGAKTEWGGTMPPSSIRDWH